MKLGYLLKNLLAAIFTCGHSRANAVEGKTFCPDCGRGVLFRWILLRCGGCDQVRPAGYRFRQVIPLTRHCIGCGSSQITRHTLQDPEWFQVYHALLACQADPVEWAWPAIFTVYLLELVEGLSAPRSSQPCFVRGLLPASPSLRF